MVVGGRERELWSEMDKERQGPFQGQAGSRTSRREVISWFWQEYFAGGTTSESTLPSAGNGERKVRASRWMAWPGSRQRARDGKPLP